MPPKKPQPQEYSPMTDAQRQTGNVLAEKYMADNLEIIRDKFNKLIEQRKEIVIINKKPFMSEYRDNGKRYISGVPYNEFKKNLSTENRRDLDLHDKLQSALNEELFKLYHDTLCSGYKWGIRHAIEKSVMFNMRTLKSRTKAAFYDQAKYGNLVGEVIEYLNMKAGTRYRESTEEHALLIVGRAQQGYTLEDFKRVIDRQVFYWLNDPDMVQYLTPDTLFNKTKFQKYVHGLTGDTNSQQDFSGTNQEGGIQNTGYSNGMSAGAAAYGKARGGRKENDSVNKFQRLKLGGTESIPK